MKKNKVNLLSNISGLTPKTKVVGGLIGLGLSLGALSLNSLSSQVTIKTFNQGSSTSKLNYNFENSKTLGSRLAFLAFIPAIVSIFGIGIGIGVGINEGVKNSSNSEREKELEKQVNKLKQEQDKQNQEVARLEQQIEKTNQLLQGNNELFEQVLEALQEEEEEEEEE